MGRRRLAAIGSAATVLAGVLVGPPVTGADPASAPTDVGRGHWARPAIEHVLDRGYLGVDRSGRFRPADRIGRGAALRSIWRLSGAPRGYPEHGRPDVGRAEDAAVRWAAAEGVDRAAGRFRAGDRATRGQALAWLWRAMGAPTEAAGGDGPTAYPPSGLRRAPRRAAEWAVADGVLDLGRDRPFRAADPIRRAELAAWLWRADAVAPVALGAAVGDTNLVEVWWRAPLTRSPAPLAANIETGLLDEPDVDALPGECPDQAWCRASFRVTRTGWTRITLTVTGGPVREVATTEVLVERLPDPSGVTRRVVVDALDPGPQVLSWDPPAGVGDRPLATDFVTVTRPGRLFPLPQRFPLDGAHVVPVADRAEVEPATWTVRYCRRPQGEPGFLDDAVCSPGAPTTFVPTGARFTGDLGGAFRHGMAPGDDLTVSWDGPGDQWVLEAPTLLDEPLVVDGTSHVIEDVAEGVHDLTLVSCAGTCPEDRDGLVRDRVQVVAGLDLERPDWEHRAVTDDHVVEAFDTLARPSTGQPLDIAVDGAGTVWAVGEFGADLARVDADGLTHVETPYRRVGGRPVTPFANPFHGPGDGPDCAAGTASALGERVLVTDDHVWFSHGGALFPPEACVDHNHSRLVRVDADGATCAVHVPGVNGQVIGLAHDPATDRIWFTEPGDTTDPAVGWFDEEDVACDGLLDYGDESAVDAAAEANRCPPTPTPGCIRRIPLGDGFAPAHLAVDPVADSVWVSDYGGRSLGRLSRSGGGPFERFPLPTPVSDGLFGGFTWQVRATEEAVYLVEYHDNQLVRFDTTAADLAASCGSLVDGRNPCVREVFLPMAAATLTAHSIDVEGDRLWFTVADEPDGVEGTSDAYVGFVDLATWTADRAPEGVIYDLTPLGAPPARPHRAPRGIDVDPATGTVAVADMGAELLLLRPR